MRIGRLRKIARSWPEILRLVWTASALIGIAQAQSSNPIVIENQQPGTTNWQIPWGSAGNDTTGQIKGYASATSVNKGSNISFYVSVNPAQQFTIDVYRIGWYQGLGGRLLQHIGPLNGTQQPTCPTDATTGMIECHWAVSYTLAAQTSWTSGVYLALLTNANGWMNYIVFVVRDDTRTAALLYQQPVATYQAYNDYPYNSSTGKSLYAFNSYGANTISGDKNAVKVSFDRPYLGDGTGIDFGNSFFSWENALVRWIEKSGYDVTYATDVDTHANPHMLLNYLGVLSAGHDEYYSKPMYDALIAAVNASVNVAFFGSDAIYWQARLEPSTSNVPNRVLVCYRDANLDPNPDSTLKTVNWRDPVLNRPEQTLIGVQYTSQTRWTSQNNGYYPYIVTNSGNWVYAGAGFKEGSSIPGLVGYEADRSFSQYPLPNSVSGTYTLLSNSPYTTNNSTSDQSNSSVYQAPSGAWVFATGTDGWSYALDNINGNNVVNPGIQQVTSNVLNRFITPLSNFSLSASPSSQTVLLGGSTNYNVSINPTGSFNGQVTFTLTGLPAGATATFTPNPGTTASTLAVTTSTNSPTGTYTLTITGTSGPLTHTATVTLIIPDFTMSGSPSSQTIVPGGSTNYNITITPSGGFNGQVNLSVTGLPSGASGSFNPNPATASSVFSVTTNPSTPTGTYKLTVTGTSGALTHTTQVTLVVNPPPDFTLSGSPSSQTVVQGGSTNYNVAITPIGGFNGSVSLSISGLPNNANGTFTPNPAATSSSLSVTTSVATPVGTYTLTITGVSGTLTHSTTVSLVVSAVPPPDFTLNASPASQTVTKGGSTNYNITINPMNGFNGQVNLSASGLPNAAIGTFTPNPATTSATLAVTTSSSTPAGTYTVTITGVSGALTHTTTVSLTVSSPGVVFDNKVSSGFNWGVTSVATPAFVIGTGANRAAMIMIAMTANNATNIIARLGGMTGTLVPGSDSTNKASVRTLIYCVIGPPSGSQSATVSWTGTTNIDIGVITATGVDQTTGCNNGTFTATNSTPAAATSVTITSNSGDLTASIGFTLDNWVSPFTNQSLRFGIDSGAVGGDTGPGTGNTTHTWTDQWPSQTVSVSGANFKAAP